jgi:hypothetical protein
MGQQHWDAAEESLKKSVSLFDPQIEKALKSDNEFVRTDQVGFSIRIPSPASRLSGELI